MCAEIPNALTLVSVGNVACAAEDNRTFERVEPGRAHNVPDGPESSMSSDVSHLVQMCDVNSQMRIIQAS